MLVVMRKKIRTIIKTLNIIVSNLYEIGDLTLRQKQ